MQIDWKRKWIVYGAAGVPVYLDPMAYVPAQVFARETGIPNEGICLFTGEIFDWLYDGDQLDEYAKNILPRLVSEGWKVYERWEQSVTEFQKIHERIMQITLTELSDDQLFSQMQEYFKAFTHQYTLNNWLEPVSYYFQHALQGLLEESGLSPEQAKQVVQDFGHPTKKSYVKLCVEEYQQAKTPEQIKRVVEKYYYLTNNFTNVYPLTEEGIKALSPEVNLHTPPSMEGLPARAQELLNVLQMTTTIQDVRKEFTLKWISGCDRLLLELARRTNKEPGLLRFATFVELMNNQIPSTDELLQRTKRCVMFWGRNGTEVAIGAEAEKLFNDFRHIVIGADQVTSLKGMAASTGKVTGRAVVILHPDQFSEVKPGDILVTVMTRPEYLPVMNIAAAFVTDEGGITSHAAIVAREMKKPCVIATKKASKVIQTGQQIEVDADTGTVTIL